MEEEDCLSLARRSQASGLVADVARGLGQMEKSGVSLSLCRKTF